jgi:dolichol-phosphate mannosyltransferase
MEKIEEGYDVAVASRHIEGGKVIGWNWFRQLNHSVSNSLLAWGLAGVHEVKDHAGNFKAIRVKNVLDSVALDKMRNAGFSFQLHILYELSKTKAKFVEVPVTFRERRFGQSKIGFNKYYLRDIVEYIRSSIFIRLDRNKNFVKYLIVGGVGFSIQSVISKAFILFSLTPSVAVAIGAEGAIISNFILNNSWTFKHKRIHGLRLFRKFFQFNVASAGGILLQSVTVGLGTHFTGETTWFAWMVFGIIFLVIPYSFFVYNRLIWKTHL